MREMTDYDKYLYYCLAEECAEVIKETMKVLRFGENDYNPSDPLKTTNLDRLRAEVIDLCAVIDMAAPKDHPDIIYEAIQAKKRKVKLYYRGAEPR